MDLADDDDTKNSKNNNSKDQKPKFKEHDDAKWHASMLSHYVASRCARHSCYTYIGESNIDNKNEIFWLHGFNGV